MITILKRSTFLSITRMPLVFDETNPFYIALENVGLDMNCLSDTFEQGVHW